jgi:hypothetical protein
MLLMYSYSLRIQDLVKTLLMLLETIFIMVMVF